MNHEFEFVQEAEEKKEQPKEKHGCPAVGYQELNVCVPITLKAFGEVENVRTERLGGAVISTECGHCHGKGDTCKFTISQKLRVEVPVIFGARAQAGEATVVCDCTEGKED